MESISKVKPEPVIGVGMGYPGDLSLAIFRIEEMLVASRGLGTSFRIVKGCWIGQATLSREGLKRAGRHFEVG